MKNTNTKKNVAKNIKKVFSESLEKEQGILSNLTTLLFEELNKYSNNLLELEDSVQKIEHHEVLPNEENEKVNLSFTSYVHSLEHLLHRIKQENEQFSYLNNRLDNIVR